MLRSSEAEVRSSEGLLRFLQVNATGIQLIVLITPTYAPDFRHDGLGQGNIVLIRQYPPIPMPVTRGRFSQGLGRLDRGMPLAKSPHMLKGRRHPT